MAFSSISFSTPPYQSSAGVVSATINIVGSPIENYGYYYGTNPPTNSVTLGSGSGGYKSFTKSLVAGTWYFQAWCYSGGVLKKSSIASVVVTTTPSVSTSTPTSITAIGATCGGNVTNTGGLTTSRGFYYGTSSPPSTQVACGTGSGSYSSALTGLIEGQLYYVRAYATNSLGTALGSILTFTTLSRPQVSTQAVTAIVAGSATGNGTVSADGSSSVTDRGICWNTSGTPTIADAHSHSGSGTGIFTSPITGTSEALTYYVRAFAINSVGTTYGGQVTFVGGIQVPSLTGGTDVSGFPNIGWSGVCNASSWTGATHIRWYNKVTSDSSYTLLATLPISGLTYQKVDLLPNISYSFYCTYYSSTAESQASNVVTINNVVDVPAFTLSSILIV